MYPFRGQGEPSEGYTLSGDEPLNIPGDSMGAVVWNTSDPQIISDTYTVPTPFPTQSLAPSASGDQYYGAAGASASCSWEPSAIPSLSAESSVSDYNNPSVLPPFSESSYHSYGNSYGSHLVAPNMTDASPTIPTAYNEGLFNEDPDQLANPGMIDAAQAPVSGKNVRRRKPKMYQWGPQEDPELEEKRVRALNRHKQRIKKEEYERGLNCTLNTMTKEVTKLREEKQRCQQTVAGLENELAGFSVGAAPVSYQQML